MRLVASAVALLALGATTAAAPKVAYLRGSELFVNGRLAARHVSGAVHWSGDGKRVSVGGQIVGGPTLPTDGDLAWAPTGETAAYATRGGGAMIWTPSGGSRRILPESWGATSLAWGANGALAIGRYSCRVPCGRPTHQEVWMWQGGRLHRVVALHGALYPAVTGVDAPGRALWWAQRSASTDADGLWLYANRSRAAFALGYPDYVSICGNHLAVATGRDRYAMHGKRILFDGRDVSRDPARSWVSPSCTADGRLVAAASKNAVPPRIGKEHRAIWQLLPSRRQLTHPPRNLSDEDPHLLPDGSVVFVRTRSFSSTIKLYGLGTVELLRNGRLTAIGATGKAVDYYGHYDWPNLVAVAG